MATIWLSFRSSARYTSPMPPRPASATMRYRPAVVWRGTKRPPPIASELENVPAEADGGRGTRGVENLGIAGDGEPPPEPPEPSLGPAGKRGAAEGVRPGPGPGATGAGESSVTPSLMSEACPSIVAAPSKPPSSV